MKQSKPARPAKTKTMEPKPKAAANALVAAGSAEEGSRTLAPRFTKGGRPGPGRPPGALNRTTVIMRDAVTAVFQDLQADHGGKGPYPHFFEWAKGNPSEFYRIAAKLMPQQLEASAMLVGRVVFRGINDEEL